MLDPRELERRKAAQAGRQHEQQAEFSKARQLLVDLIALPDLQKVFDDEWCDNAKCVYQQAPTLTLLILQRLGGGLSLSAVVEELLKHHRDILPRNRRVLEGTLAENNSAYSRARQKLPLEKVEAFSTAICDYLACAKRTRLAGPSRDDPGWHDDHVASHARTEKSISACNQSTWRVRFAGGHADGRE